MRQVGWFWGRCPLHYHKNVWLWLYNDQTSSPEYINVGVMSMDDFGDLFLVS
jgi:hypothetical protein